MAPKLTRGSVRGYRAGVMGTARLRYTGYGLLLLIVVGALLVAWLRLSHGVFAIIACVFVFFSVLSLFIWDGWRQTTTDSLASKGIYPESAQGLRVMDPGLRREYDAPLIPSALRRRTPKTPARRAPVPAATRVRRSAAPAGSGIRRSAAPAGSGIRRAAASPPPAARSARTSPARRRDVAIAPDATITLAAEWQAAGIADLLTDLDSQLIGLDQVKKKVAQVASLLLVDRARQRFELAASQPTLHMCFTGAPGTGKTTVALTMAGLLHRLGYLETPHVVHAMRDDLVGEFIGQTAPKTQHVLSRAMGGVLFIDEAYTLFRSHDSRDYGQECIDILLQVMENRRDSLVVILAGYKDRMDNFFESNPGMRSRVAHHLDFAPYDIDELLEIGELMLGRSSYYLSPEAKAASRGYLSLQMGQPGFANARSVRNALEAARFRHARRLVAEPERQWSKDDLMRLEPSDIPVDRD
jgi:probable Rubsico expression protein CbbX